MLAMEYGIHRNSINKIVSRYYQKNGGTFAEVFIEPIMPPGKIKPSDTASLHAENERFKGELKMATEVRRLPDHGIYSDLTYNRQQKVRGRVSAYTDESRCRNHHTLVCLWQTK
jgi:hypothetical protein